MSTKLLLTESSDDDYYNNTIQSAVDAYMYI